MKGSAVPAALTVGATVRSPSVGAVSTGFGGGSIATRTLKADTPS